MRLVHLNLLCLAGACLGALSLFLTWVERLFSKIAYCAFEDMSVIDILGSACHFDLALDVACGLFLIGVLLAFLTTLGALFELSGLSVFYAWYVSDRQVADWEILPDSIGPYVGVASAALVFLALVRPTGIGYDGALVGLKQRLLTIGLSRSEAGPEPP